jgi:hypothetical protein
MKLVLHSWLMLWWWFWETDYKWASLFTRDVPFWL